MSASDTRLCTCPRARFPWGTVRFDDLSVFVKYGPPHKASLEEAQTLRALWLSFPPECLPWPELYGWRVEDGINYLYMSLIPGTTLSACWPTLAHAERISIADRLATFLAYLRTPRLRPNETFIGVYLERRDNALADWHQGQSVAEGSESFFCKPMRAPVSFANAKEFNDKIQFWALAPMPVSQRPPDPSRALLSDSADTYFSHGDLHLDNIMVDGSPGSRYIISIVDRGQAGWYPAFWEYCKMHSGTADHEWCTQGWIRRVLSPYLSKSEAFENYWSWTGGG